MDLLDCRFVVRGVCFGQPGIYRLQKVIVVDFWEKDRRLGQMLPFPCWLISLKGLRIAHSFEGLYLGLTFIEKSDAGKTGAKGLVTPRDIRIDFFRGIALLIIFVAHVPRNTWDPFMPTRFGFSDAADIFVFCSGLASGIAYGGAFERRGFIGGSARVGVRCWQVYWAHISIFVFVAAMMVAADWLFSRGDFYVASLNLRHFFTGDTGANLLGLLTLTYVPNLFDILPLYVVLLAMIPVVMALSRFGPLVPLLCSVALWLVATLGYLQFPAEPFSDRPWQFHPLAWQLLFFVGFSFTRGWLPAPIVNRRMVIAAIILLLLIVPIAFWPFARTIPLLAEVAIALGSWSDKPSYGILRILHFACLAYAAYGLAGVSGSRLKGWFVEVLATVGRHSLGVFMTGIALSMVAGIVLNELGQNPFLYPFVNIAGWGILIVVAYFLGWIKSKPWARRNVGETVRSENVCLERTTHPPV